MCSASDISNGSSFPMMFQNTPQKLQVDVIDNFSGRRQMFLCLYYGTRCTGPSGPLHLAPGNFWDDNNAMHGDFGGRTRTNVGRTKDNWYSKGLMGVSDPDNFWDDNNAMHGDGGLRPRQLLG
jgi:hypothetical protein